ncbi:MAG: CoA pyrophosphatase [Pirellulaceae bacterium]
MIFDALAPSELAEVLRGRLSRGLPGRASSRSMAPELAYGRHHGPVPANARLAAVLLALVRTPSGWSIPCMLRPTTMKAHAGQVSLPGGMMELDETPAQTALREFEEELGIPTAQLEIVGSLSPVFVFISNFEVTPLVAVSREPLAYQPNPAEVAEVVEVPLAQLIDRAYRGSHLVRRRELAFRAPHFFIAGKQVWGATSLILAELAALVERG